MVQAINAVGASAFSPVLTTFAAVVPSTPLNLEIVTSASGTIDLNINKHVMIIELTYAYILAGKHLNTMEVHLYSGTMLNIDYPHLPYSLRPLSYLPLTLLLN